MPSRSNGLAVEMKAVRTLALVGAAAAGKSSLAEALLYKAGAIGACGSIERGSTVSDHDPLERRMQHSLNASVICYSLHAWWCWPPVRAQVPARHMSRLSPAGKGEPSVSGNRKALLTFQ